MKIAFDKEKIEDAISNTTKALRTEDALNKQYFIEEALKSLVGESKFNESKEDYRWIGGIAPRN